MNKIITKIEEKIKKQLNIVEFKLILCFRNINERKF